MYQYSSTYRPPPLPLPQLTPGQAMKYMDYAYDLPFAKEGVSNEVYVQCR